MNKEQFQSFNSKIFANRNNNYYEKSIHWRVFENPYFQDNWEYFHLLDGAIVGQIIPVFSKFYFNGECFICLWGSDFFVDQQYRDSYVSVVLLKKIIREHLHFGVGMSNVSEMMHLAMKEKVIGVRFDGIFFLTNNKLNSHENRTIKFIDLDTFIGMNQELKFISNEPLILSFSRSKEFYNWVLKYSNKNNIKIVLDETDNSFIMIYRISLLGINFNWIIDHSIDLTKQKIDKLLRFSLSRSIVKLFAYSGSNIFFTQKGIKYFKKHNIVTNIFNKKQLSLNENIKGVHVTSLDSDRYVSYFLK
jgi:hypothetical protein